jgi:hypothetical protein
MAIASRIADIAADAFGGIPRPARSRNSSETNVIDRRNYRFAPAATKTARGKNTSFLDRAGSRMLAVAFVRSSAHPIPLMEPMCTVSRFKNNPLTGSQGDEGRCVCCPRSEWLWPGQAVSQAMVSACSACCHFTFISRRSASEGNQRINARVFRRMPYPRN